MGSVSLSATDLQINRDKTTKAIKQILEMPKASNDDVDIYGLATARTIASLSQSILVLEGNRQISDALVLLRSSFEHLIELYHLYNGTPDFFERRKKAFVVEEDKIQKSAKAGNLWFSGLADEEFDAYREDIATAKKHFEETSEPQQRRQLAETAGLGNAYDSIYSRL